MEKINLFCLPFAGGNKYSYRGFMKYFPSFFKVIPIELPGRGARFNENLLDNTDAVIRDVFGQMEKFMNEPYAIYGHSMGTLIGYLITKKVIKENLNKPLHLFFTGGIAPSVEDDEPPKHLLPKDEFIKKIKELGGLPDEILKDDVLLDFFEPILRSDMQAIETYKYEESEPFDIPMTVIIGVDEDVTYDEALAWQKETIAKVDVRQFPGNHFFIYDFEKEIVKIIAGKLNSKILTHG